MNAAIEPHHLVALLASPSQRVRVAAIQALRTRGQEALDALRLGSTHDDANVRHACRALLREVTPRSSWRAALRSRIGHALHVPNFLPLR
ncbi:hypothetical protein [Deinococcus yavapaiensis]|uniref:HEAT repeat protein n=1 Tax=Deinococcus yavapaiensis KR-236 TaxID=694435 RepID=A0A318SIE6_9DEIO|nr:hypothetical protein [Deinococcus yavapaiensis]PYE51152.1 hypothetical protein DES52_11584 [Deinococcus yavapaiensis KR-236]